jgi:hypothetical protein
MAQVRYPRIHKAKESKYSQTRDNSSFIHLAAFAISPSHHTLAKESAKYSRWPPFQVSKALRIVRVIGNGSWELTASY